MKLYFALFQKAIFFAIIFPIPFISFAQDDSALPSLLDLMSYKEVLQVELESDFETLKSNPQSKEAEMATLSFKDQDGQQRTFNVELKLRGAFRRIRCTDFPPIKLNFKKSDLKAAGLATFDDMKLVTQCLEGDDTAKELLLKEYRSTDNAARKRSLLAALCSQPLPPSDQGIFFAGLFDEDLDLSPGSVDA